MVALVFKNFGFFVCFVFQFGSSSRMVHIYMGKVGFALFAEKKTLLGSTARLCDLISCGTALCITHWVDLVQNSCLG